MVEETLVAVERVTRRFGQRCVVADISFSISRGEVLGFLGPNGAGKSTTMNMISGVMAMSSGSIKVAGHDIVEAPVQAKQYLGFLPEKPPIYPELTVDEYLVYCARLRRVPRQALATAIAGIKQRCGLGDVGRRLLGNLSKGYQQRAGIAQALIHTPAVVILDEPTAGLDPNQIVEIRNLIRELGRDQGVILSTHILSEVQGICNRVAIMHEGKLVLDMDINAIDNLEQTFTRLTAGAQADSQS